jgi:hypothetical protein
MSNAVSATNLWQRFTHPLAYHLGGVVSILRISKLSNAVLSRTYINGFDIMVYDEPVQPKKSLKKENDLSLDKKLVKD